MRFDGEQCIPATLDGVPEGYISDGTQESRSKTSMVGAGQEAGDSGSAWDRNRNRVAIMEQRAGAGLTYFFKDI